MKTKLAIALIAISAATSGVSSAVTLALSGFANTSLGFITSGGQLVPAGRAIFISTTPDISTNLFNSLSALDIGLATSANLDSAIASAIGSTSATSPGIVRTFNFTNGAMSSLGNVELGSISNNTFMILSGESGGLVNAIGAYKGPIVPSLGAVTFNPTNSSDSIGIGTSVFTAGSPNSGFQLIPEPSAALLGALGALGLLRRRRA